MLYLVRIDAAEEGAVVEFFSLAYNIILNPVKRSLLLANSQLNVHELSWKGEKAECLRHGQY